MEYSPLMTVEQAAEYLACKVSWVYAHSRELPTIKVGHGLRFRKSDLDAWLATQRVGV